MSATPNLPTREDPGNVTPEARANAVSLARLLQFGDSAFPVGSFSFSLGLESAVQQKLVTDAATLRAFVTTATQQAASGDGIGLILAHREALRGDLDAAKRIDHAVFNRKLSESMRDMSVRMGKKLTELAAAVVKHPLLDLWLANIRTGDARGAYPVSLALLFASLQLDSETAFVAHQNGIATAILGASLRLLRVSHWETQAILFEINAGLGEAYEQASHARLEDMSSFAPLTEILSAAHTKAHVRLFMN
jgi:urease accessory protein